MPKSVVGAGLSSTAAAALLAVTIVVLAEIPPHYYYYYVCFVVFTVESRLMRALSAAVSTACARPDFGQRS